MSLPMYVDYLFHNNNNGNGDVLYSDLSLDIYWRISQTEISVSPNVKYYISFLEIIMASWTNRIMIRNNVTTI